MAALPQRSRFSALSRRIILFNAFALVVLIAGVLTVQFKRASLVEERLKGIQEQAQIVASTLAEYATKEDSDGIDVDDKAKPLLRQLLAPTRLRGRLSDTRAIPPVAPRSLRARNVVESEPLAPLGWWNDTKESVTRFYDGVMG